MPAEETSRWSETSILAGLVVYRAINACLVKTYFSPDEYWQALEVGHRITFGYGYLTWEWDVGLRSVLHPAFFAALYKALAVLGLDGSSAFIYAPRVLQAVFAALGDFYTYRFALRLFKNQLVANWTLFLSVASWWNFFCSTRTFANSTEASLTIMALYYWPFHTPPGEHTRSFGDKVRGTSASKQGSLTLSLAIASLTCIFRPTAAILWLFLGVSLVLGYIRDGKFASVVSTLISTVLIGGVAILGSAVLDSTLLYDHWTMTPLNFLRVNVLEGISLFYGSSPWHWYLSQGIPILFGIYIPLVLLGIWQSCKATTGLNYGLKSQVLCLCLWVLVVYSSLQHKEWRFLYPLLYPLLPFGANTLYVWFLSPKGWQKSRRAWAVVLVLVAVNGIMAWYTTQVHQRGVIDVMDWLRDEMRTERVRSVGMLMPCHSTPWYSSVHLKDVEPVDMWFLTCEPPLGNIDASKYEDESDVFYKDPEAFMISKSGMAPESRNSKGSYGDASHLLLFDILVPTLKPWLVSNGYHEC
ncbi:hypothetical protein BG003_004211 [Podila horticola]|nr:hypothetical protein BG003_004211 [Podila horticola]